jgi:hypothetical protein
MSSEAVLTDDRRRFTSTNWPLRCRPNSEDQFTLRKKGYKRSLADDVLSIIRIWERISQTGFLKKTCKILKEGLEIGIYENTLKIWRESKSESEYYVLI